MEYKARDDWDNLICPHPTCKTVIKAMTGLQELNKLQTHWQRKHGSMSMSQALETRAIHERMEESEN